jgi:uncharacterized repeat protein (TIGR01451 family)
LEAGLPLGDNLTAALITALGQPADAAGETTRVSLGSDGFEVFGNNYSPSISADGRFVAFYSSATNIVAGDTNAAGDVFLHDRQTARTSRVSVTSGGRQAGSYSFSPALSADGRLVAFESEADNLVPADTNEFQDVFVRDRLFDKTTSADLTLTATDAPDPAQRGQILSYAFTLTNKGTNQVADATFVDVLSSNLILNSVTPNQGSCNLAHVLVCRLGDLPKGKSAKVTVKARLRSSTPSSLNNTASALASPRDPTQTNNTRFVKTMVSP